MKGINFLCIFFVWVANTFSNLSITYFWNSMFNVTNCSCPTNCDVWTANPVMLPKLPKRSNYFHLFWLWLWKIMMKKTQYSSFKESVRNTIAGLHLRLRLAEYVWSVDSSWRPELPRTHKTYSSYKKFDLSK